MSYEAWGEPDYYDSDCRECEGTGFVTNEYDEETDCPRCGGTGFQVYDPLPDDVI